MRISELTRLKRKADAVFQKKGMKDSPNCEGCGMPAYCLHHWIYKVHSNFLRYNTKNSVPVCLKCHAAIHTQPDGKIKHRILLKRGIEWENWLQEHRNDYIKMNKAYLLSYIEQNEHN